MRYAALFGARLCALALIILIAAASRLPVVCGAPSGSSSATTFKVGLETLRDMDYKPLRGKRVGLIVNHSAIARSVGENGEQIETHAADMFVKEGLAVRFFAPEHGIRGTKDEIINDDEIDSATGISVVSLYTLRKKGPSPEDLDGLDALVFDIQEIGVRYYTYATTMVYCMKAARAAGIPFYVLDRPNIAAPLGVYGPVLDPEFHGGFAGYYPIPIAHGLTIGELARYYNAKFQIGVELFVVPMQGYDRRKFYDELGFPWRNPSPNIRSTDAAIGYHCLGMLEDMSWSVGRGTQNPFLTYGLVMPGKSIQDGIAFVQKLNALRLPGLQFSFTMFSPSSSKFQNQTCMGFSLAITNRRALNPMLTAAAVLREVSALFPDSVRAKEIDRTARSVGSRKFLAMVKAQKSPSEIEQAFAREAKAFEAETAPYKIYSASTIEKTLNLVVDSARAAENSSDKLTKAFEPLPPYERLQSAVKKAIEQEIANKAFPSAVVGVWHKGAVVMLEAFGALTYDQNAPKTPIDAIYDMASLTKVLATTLSIMKLYDEGKLRLDDSVARYVPEFAENGKSHIRLRHLLLHNSGLAAFRPYDQEVKGKTEAMKALYAEKLIYRTGDSTVYSDLGFIMLGEIIRRITGKPLDVYFADEIAKPLGLRWTMFNPDSSLRARIAPTENDTLWKQDFARPLVHDPRAALLGGVAGHAGLFSTAEDALKILAALVSPETAGVGGKPFIKPETVQLFTRRHSPKSTRALGWDTKSPQKCSCGDFFSPLSFGHTGFTGTSLWYDPVRRLGVVFLTNRVYPSSDNIKIRASRPLLHNAVVKALEGR